MGKKIAIGAMIWLFGAVFIATGGGRWIGSSRVPVDIQAAKSSGDIQKEIDAGNKKQQSAQEEKKQLEKEIAAMEAEKKDTLSYIKNLDEKQQELSEKMQSNRDNIQTARREVKRLRKEKKKAGAEKKKQYDTMKKRIKYMYENGNEGYLELMFSSRSLSELFNRAEYVTKVSNYDKNLLKNYQKLQDKIQKAENKIQTELDSLTEMRESLKVEKSSMEELVEKKEQEVKDYQNILDDKNNTLSDTETLLASQEEELERLMAAQRAAAEQEEAAKKAQEKSNHSSDKTTDNKNTRDKSNQTDNNSTTDNSSTDSKQPASSGGYCWPLTVSGRISSYFGYRSSPTAGASSYHKGIDVAVPVGTGVLAAKKGTVVTATYSSSAGNYVAISHGNGTYTYYMHCSSLSVSVGQQVSKGQRIALSGNSGISTGPHLHFAIFTGGSYVNPLNYVSR